MDGSIFLLYVVLEESISVTNGSHSFNKIDWISADTISRAVKNIRDPLQKGFSVFNVLAIRLCSRTQRVCMEANPMCSEPRLSPNVKQPLNQGLLHLSSFPGSKGNKALFGFSLFTVLNAPVISFSIKKDIDKSLTSIEIILNGGLW